MSKIGIIGGTGLSAMSGINNGTTKKLDTLYGEPSCELVEGKLGEKEVVFLARHGNPHTIPPHLVNYQANITALKKVGVTKIIAVNAVGGIHPEMGPPKVVVPDQIIDYTYERSQSFFEENLDHVTHVDFSYPYSEPMRQTLIQAGKELGIEVVTFGTYGCTQGPRLETAAEIKRMERDGCDLVGMTAMPEAVLARELNLDYASLCVSVNWAAGKTENIITMDEINQALSEGIANVVDILKLSIEKL